MPHLIWIVNFQRLRLSAVLSPHMSSRFLKPSACRAIPREDRVGARWRFDTAGQAAEVAEDIALVTGVRFMPPWLPSDLSPAYEHDWSLSDEEITLIGDWAEAGGGLDVAVDTPLVARVQAVLPIEEDQKIAPRDSLYSGYSHADGTPVKNDDYRCQVHEVADPEGDGNWVRGFEFRPDQTSVVHHAIVYRVPASATREVRAKIAAEDQIEADSGLLR